MTFLLYFCCFWCRAHSGDETGSDFLQAFAALLKGKYQELPLDRIYLMVKQYMTRIKKVHFCPDLYRCMTDIGLNIVAALVLVSFSNLS